MWLLTLIWTSSGLWKTVSYSSKKLLKMWKGWRRKPSVSQTSWSMSLLSSKIVSQTIYIHPLALKRKQQQPPLFVSLRSSCEQCRSVCTNALFPAAVERSVSCHELDWIVADRVDNYSTDWARNCWLSKYWSGAQNHMSHCQRSHHLCKFLLFNLISVWLSHIYVSAKNIGSITDNS